MAKQYAILVVEDEPEIAMLFATRLGHLGYKVTIAPDGEKALDLVKRDTFDLVLLDVMMPGKSGWDVLRTLKEDASTKHLKVIMVSAIGEIVNEVTARMYRAEGHLDKPFEFDKLEAMIVRLLA